MINKHRFILLVRVLYFSSNLVMKLNILSKMFSNYLTTAALSYKFVLE